MNLDMDKMLNDRYSFDLYCFFFMSVDVRMQSHTSFHSGANVVGNLALAERGKA